MFQVAMRSFKGANPAEGIVKSISGAHRELVNRGARDGWFRGIHGTLNHLN
jgi:hypothetical protein